jgi:mannitol/fructose-specific phosphotransferase system IIA component (Ntr-type)
MDTILDALQEGRLFELPDNDKTDALQFLAHILEAVPEIPAGTDIVGHVMSREESSVTALGKGWACPHARVPFDEDLICVIGWSPAGIDYDAPDGIPVSLVLMYLVPANQRNHYLREVSILAKALETYPGLEKLRSAKDLEDVRHYLLDLISATKETAGPDARARMIRLQARPVIEPLPIHDLSRLVIEAVTIVTGPGIGNVILAQDDDLATTLDSAAGLIDSLETDGMYQNGDWRVLRRGTVKYQEGRVAYDCLAIRLASQSKQT